MELLPGEPPVYCGNFKCLKFLNLKCLVDGNLKRLVCLFLACLGWGLFISSLRIRGPGPGAWGPGGPGPYTI